MVYLDEFANTINLSIFPNPISNFVTINSKTEFKSIVIRNILSKEIFRIENSYNLNSLKLDFTNFKSGVYIISILSIDGNLIVSKKIIKK